MFPIDIADFSETFSAFAFENLFISLKRSFIPSPLEAPSLHVRKVSAAELPEVEKIALVWNSVALELASKNEQDRDALEDNALISRTMASVLHKKLSSNQEVYICETEKSRIAQGLMVVSTGEKCPEKIIKEIVPKDTCLEVDWLVTRPGNMIRSNDRSQDPNKVKGAGSALLTQAETRAVFLKSKAVFLTSMPLAEPFYASRGFKVQRCHWGNHYFYKPTGISPPRNNIPMHLRRKFSFF